MLITADAVSFPAFWNENPSRLLHPFQSAKLLSIVVPLKLGPNTVKLVITFIFLVNGPCVCVLRFCVSTSSLCGPRWPYSASCVRIIGH